MHIKVPLLAAIGALGTLLTFAAAVILPTSPTFWTFSQVGLHLLLCIFALRAWQAVVVSLSDEL